MIGATNEGEADRPVLVRVADSIGPHAAALFIGNRLAAEDPALLFAHAITSTMNVAVNVEIGPLTLPDGAPVRRTQIGLIDGPGNTASHLLAAVLALDGILGQASPGKPSYPPHRAGNVLVHCRAGHSRSVTVLALYLHLAMRDRYPSLDEAVDHLRRLRQLQPHQPKRDLLILARQILQDPASARLSFAG